MSIEKKEWYSGNYGIEIELSLTDIDKGYHTGECEPDILELLQIKYIKDQTDKWDKDTLKKELSEYGAWDDTELNNHADNIKRMLWLACGDIFESQEVLE